MTRDLVKEFQQAIGELPPDEPLRRCTPPCRLEDAVAKRDPGRPGWERVACPECGRYFGHRPIEVAYDGNGLASHDSTGNR